MSSKDSFASLFEEENKNAPKARRFKVGDKIRGTVVQVGKDSAFVELDGKRQAFIDVNELRAPDGTVTVKVGDTLDAAIVFIDDETGEVRIGRSFGKTGNIAAIEQARNAGVAIDGKVSGINKGGLEVDLDGVRAFCPISQADNKFVQDPSQFVGRTFSFMVTDIREGGKNVLLSRRAVLEEEARGQRDALLRTLQVGNVVRGTVSSIREFGVFVDLGGLEGLIPNSELSYDRSASASGVVSPGDVVDVQVREIKEVAPTRPGGQTVKVALSLKALSADPWIDVDTQITEGKVATGTVTRLLDFGAFVKLAPGIEGLLHVSELGAKVEHPSKVLKVGQTLSVVVQNIDRTKKKISLVPAPDGLGVGSTVQSNNFVIGSIVNATVDKIETFGVFVQVEGTKGRAGRGLIPSAELGTPRGSDTRKLFPEGMKVTAKVLETGDGRLRLSIRKIGEDEERADFDGYRETSATKTLGTFGDLLAQKLKK
jgi:small subunit ribosomal protein S1